MKKMFSILFLLLIIGMFAVSAQPELSFPEIDVSNAIHGPSIEGEKNSLMLNNLEISYYSTVASYPFYGEGADILIKIKNIGENMETFQTTPISELRMNAPPGTLHFFSFQPDEITLKANEEKTIHYFSSNDAPGESTLDIDFWQGPSKATATIKLYSGNLEDAKLSDTAIVYGTITDTDGGPIRNAEIRIQVFSGGQSYYGMTDAFGRYVISLPSADDIKALFGEQDLLYNSLSYFVMVDKMGYEHYYQDGLLPKTGEKLENDFKLEKRISQEGYELEWENKVSDYYGFFYTFTDDNWNYIAAAQAKHPPELGKPTNFYLFDAKTGELKWKQPTGDDCWGFDISRDGSMIAAGCNDNYVYLVDSDGNLKWKKDSGVSNREVELSHDGKYVLTGPYGNYDFALLKTEDGSLINGFTGIRESLRNSKFTKDDSEFVVGQSFGYTSMYKADGTKVWTNYVGEFPLFLAIDNQGNTYAAGKGRTLFKFDKDGNIKWSYRVPDHVVTSGAISEDGSRIAIGTVGAWVYYINGKNGQVIWRNRIDGENVGHNAVSISKDGKYVAVGGAPEYTLFVFNEKGTRILVDTSQENDDPILEAKWATIGKYASTGTQKGVMGTYISADGKKIVAGYGDNYIREFKWVEFKETEVEQPQEGNMLPPPLEKPGEVQKGCGDGICDEYEAANKICPKDCGWETPQEKIVENKEKNIFSRAIGWFLNLLGLQKEASDKIEVSHQSPQGNQEFQPIPHQIGPKNQPPQAPQGESNLNNPKCPDRICDEYEKADKNLCPADCE